MKRGKERGKQRNEEKCRGVEPRIRGPSRKDPPSSLRDQVGFKRNKLPKYGCEKALEKKVLMETAENDNNAKEKGGKFRGSAVQTQCHKPVHNFTDYRG